MATCGIGLYLRAARAIRLPEFSHKCNFLIRMWFGIALKTVQKLFNYNRHLFFTKGNSKVWRSWVGLRFRISGTALKGGAANVLCTWTAAQRDLSQCVLYSLPPRRRAAARLANVHKNSELIYCANLAFSGVFSLAWRTFESVAL